VGEVFLPGKEGINKMFWSFEKAHWEWCATFTLKKDELNLEQAHGGAGGTIGGTMGRVLYQKALWKPWLVQVIKQRLMYCFFRRRNIQEES